MPITITWTVQLYSRKISKVILLRYSCNYALDEFGARTRKRNSMEMMTLNCNKEMRTVLCFILCRATIKP